MAWVCVLFVALMLLFMILCLVTYGKLLAVRHVNEMHKQDAAKWKRLYDQYYEKWYKIRQGCHDEQNRLMAVWRDLDDVVSQLRKLTHI